MPLSRRACRWRSLVLSGVFLALALGSFGCPSSEKLVPVSGKVTLGGKALSRGGVSFRPDKSRGNNSTAEPYGDITAEGTYTLFTNGQPGAPPGAYLVLVAEGGEATSAPRNPALTKYSDPQNPVLKLEVVENAPPGQYDLTLSK